MSEHPKLHSILGMIKSSLLGLNRPNQITSLSPTQICTVFQASHGRTRQTSVCCFHTKLGVLSPYHDLSNIYCTRSSDTTLKSTPHSKPTLLLSIKVKNASRFHMQEHCYGQPLVSEPMTGSFTPRRILHVKIW